jgi:RimJ/RimL family protein N-acetyltransferase
MELGPDIGSDDIDSPEAAVALAQRAFARGAARAEIRCPVTDLVVARAALAAGFGFESIRRLDAWHEGTAIDQASFVRTARDSGAPILAVRPPLGRPSDGVIALRLTEREDAGALLAEQQDAESIRWALGGPEPDLGELESSAARAGLDWIVSPMGRLAMVDVESGEVAGSLQLRRTGPPQVAGIGYGVLAPFRGRGYTTRALRLLSAWAFAESDIARLELGAKSANVASQRAAVNAGFELQGVNHARLRNLDGTFSDEVQYALFAPDPATAG